MPGPSSWTTISQRSTEALSATITAESLGANRTALSTTFSIAWATSKENLNQTFRGEREELEAFDIGLKRILEENGKSQYYEQVKMKNNAASGLLKMQIMDLTRLKREKKIDDFEHSDLVKHINEFFNLQGGCERIKSTPLFRQYSIFSRVFVKLFIFLLPFGLLKEMKNLGEWSVWLTALSKGFSEYSPICSMV